MADLTTSWTDSIGMQVNAAYLNALDTAVNTNTHAQVLAPGTFSARPAAAAGNTGALYFCTDCDAVYRSNGTAWTKLRFDSSAGPSIADPPTTGWTAVNMQTGSSWAADVDGMLFTIASAGANHSAQCQYRTYPTPPFTLTAHLDYVLLGTIANWSSTGLFISDGTKLLALEAAAFSSWLLYVSQYANTTSVSANPVSGASYIAMPKWFRFVDDGTNIFFKISLNGLDWIQIYTAARTAYLTPTRIGVFGDNYSGSTMLMRCRSWTGVA